MKFMILLVIFLSLESFAKVEVPETIVEISIFDLIPKEPMKKKKITGKVGLKKVKPIRPPENYGNEVAKRIVASEDKLMSCLGVKKKKKSVMTKLHITSGGKARLDFIDRTEAIITKEEPEDICIKDVLTNINYPKHDLKREITLKVPLNIEVDVI